MSSKLRLDEITFSDEEFDNDMAINRNDTNFKKKQTKTKRKKQDSEGYMHQRIMKRGVQDSHDYQ